MATIARYTAKARLSEKRSRHNDLFLGSIENKWKRGGFMKSGGKAVGSMEKSRKEVTVPPQPRTA